MEVFKGFVEKNKNIELLNREYPTADDIRKKEIEKEALYIVNTFKWKKER